MTENVMTDDVRQRVQRILGEIIKDSDSLAEIGAKSVTVLRLTSAIEKEFNISVDLVDVFQVKAPEDVVHMVEAALMRKGGEE